MGWDGLSGKYVSKRNKFEFYYKWENVRIICETKRYIFIRMKGLPDFTIFKYLLPAETISSIKKIIAKATVPQKKLL